MLNQQPDEEVLLEPQVVAPEKAEASPHHFPVLIEQPNESVKRNEGLILIEGYAVGNNRQLTKR